LPKTRATLPAGRSQPALHQKLQPCARFFVSGCPFVVTKSLGNGSFGTVWGARDINGGAVAVKEISCSSEEELRRVAAEAHLLRVAREKVLATGGAEVADRLPVLVASCTEVVAPQRWRVRIVMSEVHGRPVEEILAWHQRSERLKSTITLQECCGRFDDACRFAVLLVTQLAPLLEAFSPKVCHRDVTPRNIQVAGIEAGRPQFGLVDFGLAVDAEMWRKQDSSELGGDGRYWPPSAWFVFAHGMSKLKQHSSMEREFRRCLDAHSLGLTALRCLVEMLPNLDAVADAPKAGNLHDALRGLRDVERAWSRYWADARAAWQPIFEAFQGKGEFEALSADYARAGVHRIIGEDLRALRRSLLCSREACVGLSRETGLADMAALFDAILCLLQCSEEGPAPIKALSPEASYASSTSTVTPDASPTSSPSPSAAAPRAMAQRCNTPGAPSPRTAFAPCAASPLRAQLRPRTSSRSTVPRSPVRHSLSTGLLRERPRPLAAHSVSPAPGAQR